MHEGKRPHKQLSPGRLPDVFVPRRLLTNQEKDSGGVDMKKMVLLSATILISLAATVADAKGLAEYLEKKGVITDNYYPDIAVRGRLHMDAGLHDEDTVRFGDGFNARRARIGISGNLDAHWSFVLEYDFAEEDVSAADLMFAKNLGGGSLKIGQFKVPMGLNELTSSNNITFIERASNSNIVADARRIGIGFDYHERVYGVQSMVYGRSMGSREGAGDDMPIGAGGRLYANPVHNDDWMVHLGLSAAYENRRDYDSLRFRDRPEARADSDIRLIDTGSIAGVDATFKTGLELAFQQGPLSMEGEYLKVYIDNDDDPRFDGYHIQASYVLTGESRGYRNGVFRSVTPKNTKMGAWETAIRFSSVDLNDSGINGGKQENISLGVNYYAARNVRFMANIIFVDVTDSGAEADNGAAVGDDSPNIFMLRAQYSF